MVSRQGLVLVQTLYRACTNARYEFMKDSWTRSCARSMSPLHIRFATRSTTASFSDISRSKAARLIVLCCSAELSAIAFLALQIGLGIYNNYSCEDTIYWLSPPTTL